MGSPPSSRLDLAPAESLQWLKALDNYRISSDEIEFGLTCTPAPAILQPLLLLERDDIDPNMEDCNGRTPLWWAARKGHNVVVRLLLEHHNTNPKGGRSRYMPQ